MRFKTRILGTMASVLWCSSILADQVRPGLNKEAGVNHQAAMSDFLRANPHAKFLTTGSRITRVFGPAFGFGNSAEDSAEQFRLNHAGIFGIESEELDPRGPLFDERHTQGVMFDRETGTYKFTLVFYTQYESGTPVFRSDLRLLVRNEPGHPLVLASSSLRGLGAFSVDQVNPIDFDRAKAAALEAVPALINFSDPRRVIWAGYDNIDTEPAVAVEFTADNGVEGAADEERWLFVTDAETGDILFQENQILNTDVVGNVSGQATQGIGADICETEAVEVMPYARVNIGTTQTFADVNGDFTIPNAGTDLVTVQSPIRGLFFFVDNQSGADTVLSQDVTPPGPADFIHNPANGNEFQRAEVNAYVEANVVRDWIVRANPSYPIISTQTNFRVNVNINSNCNAFYNGSSINFYTSGGGCSNTANTTIVHHEYGHHLVSTGGSGQGQYGEGMGDVLGVIITDQPVLAVGFQLDCNAGLRSADNNLQYPCGGGIHFCGQLISGCVWDTRNELIQTEPLNYALILMDLSVNSVLLHSGTEITPQITVDWLTLDDDDADITNGTPHYFEIDTGFGAHGMPAPPLDNCNNSGSCDAGEDCETCPDECLSGTSASCGNGICEAGDGEDCLSCPDDCNGKQNGRPDGRFCCGDGDGQNPLPCSDPLCGGGGFDCTDVPGTPSCCGDSLCEGVENGFNCDVDCGPPPPCGDASCDPGEDCGNCPEDCASAEVCNDGTDNDCDGLADCDDSDCDGDPDCQCEPLGAPCTDDGECCSNKCRGKPDNKACK